VRALIPYFVLREIPMGPFHPATFGLSGVLAVTLGLLIATRQARRRGLDTRPLADAAFWAVLVGCLAAHLVHVLLYHPEELHQNGALQLVRFWDGLASTGGVAGGLLALVVYFRIRRLPFARYADSIALGVTPGWAVGRIGCFLIHDHPGARTTFPLAVRFPAGARHDLGLDEALLLIALTALLWVLSRRRWFEGRLTAVLGLTYGLGRLGLDFLRATDLSYVDPRYFGLTPAQYGCLAIMAYGAWALRGGSKRPVEVLPGT
jgi:phosphatidylglycerol:prolipoprotein diacylglycerol transferase